MRSTRTAISAGILLMTLGVLGVAGGRGAPAALAQAGMPSTGMSGGGMMGGMGDGDAPGARDLSLQKIRCCPDIRNIQLAHHHQRRRPDVGQATPCRRIQLDDLNVGGGMLPDRTVHGPDTLAHLSVHLIWPAPDAINPESQLQLDRSVQVPGLASSVRLLDARHGLV